MATGPEICVTQASMPETGSSGILAALLLLSKPGIVLAEVVAGLAGLLLAAAEPSPAPAIAVLLAIAMAAGGAAMLNGILDAGADRQMSRLARRCRALEITGARRVLAIALTLMAFGLGLAAITLPLLALLLLAGACLSYLYLYTFWLKRRSPWGVLAGGIPGALPPLIGAAAVSGSITAPPLLLAGFVFIWQLPHFWLLALDCHDQYSRAGIPVLPLTHGESFTRICTLSATLLLLPVTLTLGLLGGLSSCFLAVAGVAGGIFSLYCARCLYQTHAYRRGFVASLIYILIIFAAICAG
jgi:protoheme IX farnesyltransferase